MNILELSRQMGLITAIPNIKIPLIPTLTTVKSTGSFVIWLPGGQLGFRSVCNQ